MCEGDTEVEHDANQNYKHVKLSTNKIESIQTERGHENENKDEYIIAPY